MTHSEAGNAARDFDALYMEHRDSVYRFALWQMRNVDDAEDITSQTFLQAFRSFERVQPDMETVRTWLLRIARNLATDHRRAEARRHRLAQLVGRSAGAAENVEHTAEVNSELRRALGIVGGMKNRDQVLIALRVGGRLSYREIGAVVGMSESTAAQATIRAMERVRKLSAQGEGE